MACSRTLLAQGPHQLSSSSQVDYIAAAIVSQTYIHFQQVKLYTQRGWSPTAAFDRQG
jgi:hypothetical protein